MSIHSTTCNFTNCLVKCLTSIKLSTILPILINQTNRQRTGHNERNDYHVERQTKQRCNYQGRRVSWIGIHCSKDPLRKRDTLATHWLIGNSLRSLDKNKRAQSSPVGRVKSYLPKVHRQAWRNFLVNSPTGTAQNRHRLNPNRYLFFLDCIQR